MDDYDDYMYKCAIVGFAKRLFWFIITLCPSTKQETGTWNKLGIKQPSKSATLSFQDGTFLRRCSLRIAFSVGLDLTL